jgi:hypothetical protein
MMQFLNSRVGRCSGLPCNALNAREFDNFCSAYTEFSCYFGALGMLPFISIPLLEP